MSDYDFGSLIAPDDHAARSPLEEAQRALGFMGVRHELVLRLFRLATEWLDEPELLQGALEVLGDTCGAEAGSVIMLDRVMNDLYFAAATGPVSQDIKSYRLGRGEGIAGWCMESGRVVRITNVEAEPRWHREISEQLGFNVRQVLAAPISVRNRVVGCVELINKLGGDSALFVAEDEELIGDAAECIGILFALRGRRVPT